MKNALILHCETHFYLKQMIDSVRNIEIAEYDYPLPDERIAKYPLKERDTSKLLVYNKGNVSEDVFRNLPEYIPAGSLMIFNNTKVIQARLRFRKPSGAQIEVFCLEPETPSALDRQDWGPRPGSRDPSLPRAQLTGM